MSIELEINKRVFNNRYCPPDTNRFHEAIAILSNILTLDSKLGRLGE